MVPLVISLVLREFPISETVGMRRSAGCLVAGQLLASCGATPLPTISAADVNGTYQSLPCPNIEIRDSYLLFHKTSISFELINIKGDNILAADATPFFRETGGACLLGVRAEPRYIFLRQLNEATSIEVFSEDQKFTRTFTKTSGR